MAVRVIPRVDLLPEVLDGRIVGHVRSEPGERAEWELHRDQDELLYLISGVTEVVLRADPGDAVSEQVLRLRAGQACVVPKGAWHRQIVLEPSVLLFVSPPSEHVPYVPTDGWADDPQAAR